jgi:hypothetical protein
MCALADTWYLWRLFGWPAPLACYGFLLVGLTVNTLFLRSLVRLVYGQVGGCLRSYR